jgi:hypothetical protein
MPVIPVFEEGGGTQARRSQVRRQPRLHSKILSQKREEGQRNEKRGKEGERKCNEETAIKSRQWLLLRKMVRIV